MKLYKRFFKRGIDVTVSGCALLVLAMPLVVVALWLHFANRGAGAFFFQERPGKGGKIFRMVKFKSMTDERDANGKLLPDAQRLTKAGRFVRSTSIDELPQLWNVFKGDMSLIGPRPLLPRYLPYYTEREMHRHDVRPGITGLAQVNGRNNISWERMFEYDVQYVENITFMNDVDIILATIKKVFQRKDINVAPKGVFMDEERKNRVKRGNAVILERYNLHGYDLSVVRDDLYPQPGGGVKSRKSAYYEACMLKQGYDACVTTGGIQSNHNRAIALMCARNGWRCHIVYHGTRKRFEAEKGNALLVRKSGASVEFVEADQIGQAMDVAMERLKAEGCKPMYIHGGGHDLPGGMALVDAVKELKAKCDTIGYKPKYIFHASGTGSTQAGIAVGLDLVGWSDVKLIGISVARPKERGTQVIEDFANMLAEYYGLQKDYRGRISFNTDYLCGGYEQYAPEMTEYLDCVMRRTGLMFDTTYSGKAFYGMMNYVEKNDIPGDLLFWHTGGLMNMMK